jgi:serine/threonine protein kinase
MLALPKSHSRQPPSLNAATRAAPCDILREFALAWRLGRRPLLTEFISRVPSKERFPLALQLVELDVRQRAVRGDIAAPGDYRGLRFVTDDQRWQLADLVSRVVARVSRIRLGSDSLTSAGLDQPRGLVSVPHHHSAQWIEAQPEPPQEDLVEATPFRSWRGPKASWRGGPVRAGRFTLLEELGRGGMGVVYRARQTGVDREVALKMISAGSFAGPVERERFYREARLTARLDHPNIVPVLEVGEIDGCPFLSMPLVEGTTLKGLIAERPLSAVEAARLMAQVAEALAHAHLRGVIHRDIKPQNILISREGRVRVADFGLARDALRPGDLTPAAEVLGTPEYMSPEQAMGRSRGAASSCDIYSMGATLYTLLTGIPPFRASRTLELLRMVATHTPVPPERLNPDVPMRLSRICLRCLAKNPADRPASAEDLASDLRRFLAESARGGPLSRSRRLSRWQRTGVSWAVVTALAITAWLGLAPSQPPDPRSHNPLAHAAPHSQENLGPRHIPGPHGLPRRLPWTIMAGNHTHTMDLDTWPSVREGLPGKRDFKDPFSLRVDGAIPEGNAFTSQPASHAKSDERWSSPAPKR